MENEIKTLDELFGAMKSNDARTLNQHGSWSSDLPTFGGEDIDCESVWSWDKTRAIVGENSDNLEIVNRTDLIK